MTPKCSTWLGHKFEGRYSKGPARSPDFEGAAIALIELAEKFRTVTYEGDVCTRCGCVVNERNRAPISPETPENSATSPSIQAETEK